MRPARFRYALPAALAAMIGTAQAQPAGDTLTVAFGAESTTVDPFKYGGGVDQYFLTLMFDYLIRPDNNLKTINWLAESWSIEGTKEKPIIDVRLRKGVKFHNGDPLTSEDYEFAFNGLRDPKISRNSHFHADVERFEIVDPHHFRLHFKQPDGLYVSSNLQLWAIPKKYYQSVGAEGFAKAPVGTGPWKFVSRKIKEEIRFEAFEDFWNKEHRPKVKNLVIKIIPEDLTRVAAFKTGAVDWIDAVPLAMVDEFKKMPGVKTATFPSGNNLMINFNSDDPKSPFHDVRVRKAAAHAVDVDAIIKTVLHGQGERYIEVGKGSSGYDPNLKGYAYDPKRARELLREAGYPNGFEIPCYNLTTPREPNVKEFGEATFAYLTQSGIRCKVRGLEYAAWLSFARRRDAPPPMDGVILFMSSHWLPGDPNSAWSGHLHSRKPQQGWGNFSYTNDAEADRLVEQLKQTMDPAERHELTRKIAKYKNENVLGGVTTYRPVVTFAWRDKVDFTPWPTPGGGRGLLEIGFKK